MGKDGREGERRNRIDTVFVYLKNKIIIKEFKSVAKYRKMHNFLKDTRSDRMKVNILERANFLIRE